MDPTIEKLAERVMEMLIKHKATGAANAIPQSRVASFCGTNTRRVQMATLLLNERGVAVVSSCERPFGIFIAATRDELSGYESQLRSRLIGNARRRRHIRKMIRELDARQLVEPSGQRRLFT